MGQSYFIEEKSSIHHLIKDAYSVKNLVYGLPGIALGDWPIPSRVPPQSEDDSGAY